MELDAELGHSTDVLNQPGVTSLGAVPPARR
jgi:hypothetical protein